VQALVPVVFDDPEALDCRAAVIEDDGFLFERQAPEEVLHALLDW
jgi:hypothetical protein